jgi:putative chitinase
MTPAMLAAAVGGMPAGRAALWAPLILLAWNEFGIREPADRAMFLAQCGHESASFRFNRELWGPTDSQQRYERNFALPWPRSASEAWHAEFAANRLAFQLGNSELGDGRRFMGRGPLQLTGRDNYREFGAALGLDLVHAPDIVQFPHVGIRVAGSFWHRRGLSELSRDLERATRVINGGQNGLDDRRRRLGLAQAALGV